MNTTEAKDILTKFLNKETVTRGELMDAIHVASIESMKQFSDPTMDKELVKIFEELAEQVSKSGGKM